MLWRGTSSERSLTATWPAKAFRMPLRTRALSFTEPPVCGREPPPAGAAEAADRFYTLWPVTQSHAGEARGLALIALSTLAYGVQPIFGKVAYAAGVEPLPLLAWRYLIALVCLELLERGPRPPLRERLRLWGIGSSSSATRSPTSWRSTRCPPRSRRSCSSPTR